MLVLPRLPKRRPTEASLQSYDTALKEFCGLILEINSIDLILRSAHGAVLPARAARSVEGRLQ
jgi:hypothetical protein